MHKICAFFGHRDTVITTELEQKFEQHVINLINQGITEFWCCNEGNFDWLSRMVLLRIKQQYSHICLCYICAYNPDKYAKSHQNWLENHFDIIYPDEVAETFPKYAITKRNNYIADNADIILCYIKYNTGGAYLAVKRAQKQGKTIINLA